MKKILCFFGTRPEAIKMAPVVKRLESDPRLKVTVAVSAQHREMLDQVLKIFGLKAHIDLDLMRPNQSLFALTARVIQKFEPALKKVRPNLVLVHGDTTTTLAGTLASYYEKIPVGHVEAGLRTHDRYRPFPEEMNRQLTDNLASLHFAPTQGARANLRLENLGSPIFITGNTVIDALLSTAKKTGRIQSGRLRNVFRPLKKNKTKIILLTAHRRENFGEPFKRIFQSLRDLCGEFPRVHWIYPVHPNPNVKGAAQTYLRRLANMHLVDPLGYGDMVQVMKAAHLVVTDSGGLQEEAPSLGKPVLVLREVTERPEAVEAGTVRLVGSDPKRIKYEVERLLIQPRAYQKMAAAINPYGDGRAAQRIYEAILWFFGFKKTKPLPFSSERVDYDRA